MNAENETLRGLLVFGFVVVFGLFLYWLHIFFQLMSMFPSARLAAKLMVSPPRSYQRERYLLETINKAHENTGWDYLWIGPVSPPGEIVLVWREWQENNGAKNRTLDVLIVKRDGSVETLGVGVEYEVFGKPQEM